MRNIEKCKVCGIEEVIRKDSMCKNCWEDHYGEFINELGNDYEPEEE